MTTSSPPDVIDVIPVLKPEPADGGPSWLDRLTAALSRHRWPLLGLLVLLALGALVWRNTRPQPQVLMGQVEMQEIDIVAPGAGVLTRLLVQAGQQVEAGAPLFELDGVVGGAAAAAAAAQADAASAASAASAAAQLAASAAQAAAAAQETSPAVTTTAANTAEVIQARAELERARVDAARFERSAELAYAAYQRAVGLYEDSMIESSARDTAQAQWNAADAQVRGARARLEQVRRRVTAVLAAAPQVAVPVARSPAPATASAAPAAAASASAGVSARAQSVAAAAGAAAPGRSTLRAPLAGEVERVAVRAGTRVAAGQWLMSLLNPSDVWVVTVVREDVLPSFAFGTVHKVEVPALSTVLELRVDSLTQLPDFATWRAMGGAELRSFEVRLRADKLPPGLRPGMAVVFAAR
jgi:HlyD family secretion protein